MERQSGTRFCSAQLEWLPAGPSGTTATLWEEAGTCRRRREMGVRIALGANPRDVFAMVLAQRLRTTALGAAIGIVAALGLTRLLEACCSE